MSALSGVAAPRCDTSPLDPCLTSWHQAQFRDASAKKEDTITRPTSVFLYLDHQGRCLSMLSLFCHPRPFIEVHSLGWQLGLSAVRSFGDIIPSLQPSLHFRVPRIFSRHHGVTGLLPLHSGAAVERPVQRLSSKPLFRLFADAHRLLRRHIVWAELLSVPSRLCFQPSLQNWY